jgi:hypothetical protein
VTTGVRQVIIEVDDQDRALRFWNRNDGLLARQDRRMGGGGASKCEQAHRGGTRAGHGGLEDTSWPKPAPAECHLKLVAAAAAGLADPVRLVDAQRHGAVGRVGRRAAGRVGRAE